MSRRRPVIGHARAAFTGALIVLYFTLSTIWLPSALLRSSLLTGAERTVSDLIALAVWAGGFALGIWGLRRAQERGWI
jgi:hypothetical protein